MVDWSRVWLYRLKRQSGRMSTKKDVIGILTGGGDVPGLNPAIRAVTIRALREGYKVIGLRRGWLGPISILRDEHADNSEHFQILTEEIVNRTGRTGGTFLHTSRTNPPAVKKEDVPEPLRATYHQDKNDLTSEVIKNLDWLGIDYLIPIGGDDTLSFATRLHKEGVKVVAIPKTMDNDVPGTDYCIGFSTCVSRTIELSHRLRTSAGSHERFLVMEVFGRYAGFTAMLPTMAGAADRCVIPEYAVEVEHLAELLTHDRNKNPSRYSVVLVSEGARLTSHEGMSYEGEETDMFGHRKLGGIGEQVGVALRDASPKYNKGRRIDVVNQRLGYLVRSGDPDALDSIVPMAFGNLALDLIRKKEYGRLVSIHRGFYDSVPLASVTSEKKVVDVSKYYNTKRLRPIYQFDGAPLFIMTSDWKTPRPD